MERHAFAMKVKDGQMNAYRTRLGEIWKDLTAFLDRNQIKNFSIWSAGGYIFGYDEIDTTMEIDETPQDREATVAWETRQLVIMDWITNDVDWMTGEWHPASRRLAWHN